MITQPRSIELTIYEVRHSFETHTDLTIGQRLKHVLQVLGHFNYEEIDKDRCIVPDCYVETHGRLMCQPHYRESLAKKHDDICPDKI